MINVVNSNYYVKRLPENPVNKFKWIYIDSADGNLKIVDNKWYFDFKFYLIQNLYLPLNVFSLDLSTQFSELTGLNINVTTLEYVPDWIVQKNYCTAYSLTFNIDTNDSKFFEQILTNYDLYFNFKLEVDSQILSNAKLELDQNEFDEFVNECYSQTNKISFKYSNYNELTINDDHINMPNNYYLNSYLGSYSNDEIIYYSLNNEIDYIDEPIKKLLTINFSKEYTIISKKVNFIYQIIGKPQESISYEDTTPLYGSTPLTINYDFCTYFNESESKIENQIYGVNGFYCPLNCAGYYEVLLKLIYNGVVKTLKFINNFSFKGNEDFKNKKIQVTQIFINNIEFFKELNF